MLDFIKKIIYGFLEIIGVLMPIALYLLIYGSIIYVLALGLEANNNKAIKKANESTCEHDWQITSNYHATYKVCNKCFIKIRIY